MLGSKATAVDCSIGYFGDLRLMRVGSVLFERIISIGSGIIKRLSHTRAEQVRFNRFLWNPSVTSQEIKDTSLQSVHDTCFGDHVLAIQDTTEVNLARRQSKITGLGVVGNDTDVGLLCHSVIAVDPRDGFVLGPCGLKVWSRNPERSKIRHRVDRWSIPVEQKEIYRWVECAQEAKGILSNFKKVTVIGDREFDFYAAFHQLIDERTDLLLRSKNKRRIEIGDSQLSLDDFIDNLNVIDTRQLEVSSRSALRQKRAPSGKTRYENSQMKREARLAELELKFSKVLILKPKQYYDKQAPKTVSLHVIDVTEKVSKGIKYPLHWRLLTSHEVTSVERAWELVDWYKKRWLIEQLFRTAKRGGLDTEGLELTKGESIEKLVTMMIIASIKILQLTMARSDIINRDAHHTFTDNEIEVLESLNKQYEGKTIKQKNPYLTSTLARCMWVIARIGGWKGYDSEGPPGPTTLMRGLRNFTQIFYGWSIAKNVCIS